MLKAVSLRNKTNNLKTYYKMKADKTIYLSREDFENKLENEFTIVYYPNKKHKYYICIENLLKSIKVYIK